MRRSGKPRLFIKLRVCSVFSMSAKLVPPSEMIHYSIEQGDVNMRDTHGVLALLLAANSINESKALIFGEGID